MLEESVIPIEFGSGIDSKTDPKKIKADKFLRLENGVFTKPNQIAKRNGYSPLTNAIIGGGNLVSPQLLHDFKDQLICADKGTLYTWSDKAKAWSPAGPYTSVALSVSPIDQIGQGSGSADSVVSGGYILYAWSTAFNDSVSDVFFKIVDKTTGATVFQSPVLCHTILGTASLTPVRAVLIGSSQLAIAYVNSAQNAVVFRTIAISGSGAVTYSVEIPVTTNFALPAKGIGSFDVVTTTTACAVLYQATTGLKIVIVDTAGAPGTPVIIDNDAAIFRGLCYLSQTSNGNLWAYYETADFKYAVVNSSLASVLAPTVISAGAAPLSNITSFSQSATVQSVYFGVFQQTGPTAANSTDVTNTATVSSAGAVGAVTRFANGVAPYSKPFQYGGLNYAVFCYRGVQILSTNDFLGTPTQQSTFFLIQLGGPAAIVVGRFAQGLAMSFCLFNVAIAYSPNLAILSPSQFVFAMAKQVQAVSPLTSYSIASGLNFFGLMATFSYIFDFNGTSNYIASDAANMTILNGALLSAFDGLSCSEFGFHLFPEIITYTQNAGLGFIAAGTYYYQAVFQWIDAQGNNHQSEPSPPFKVVVAAANSNVIIYVSAAYLTQKQNVVLALSRTQTATTSATVYYEITGNDLGPLAGVDANAYVDVKRAITDVYGDTAPPAPAGSSLSNNNPAYTYPSSPVLPNTATAPSTLILSHNNRLWYVNAEAPNEVWYTKSFSPGNGLAPSAFLLEQIDPKFGNIAAIAEMDEKLVVLKESGFCVLTGDGADDTGAGSSLSPPQFVPSDVGCDNPKSVIITPQGLLFHTINGIYTLNRSLQVSYLGMEVEKYNAQVITSANLVPGKSQIRFLCSTGLTLVYDYIFGQWATFTNHTGAAATAWNGSYVYASGANVLQETPGLYADNGTAFALLLQTGWLALSSVQNFQRVRRFLMLGDFTNGASNLHGMSVAAAYDFSTTFQPAVPYTFGAASASKTFQYRERLPIQKCDAISLLITELTTGDNLEYLDLTNMSFEAGVKKGASKLAAAQSVG